MAQETGIRLSTDELARLQQHGYQNIQPLETTRFPALHAEIERMSAILKRPVPRLFLGDRASAMPNASAMGNGVAIVDRRMFDHLNEPEIAAVLGHEMIHLEHPKWHRFLTLLPHGVGAVVAAGSFTALHNRAALPHTRMGTAFRAVASVAIGVVANLLSKSWAIRKREDEADLESTQQFGNGPHLASAFAKLQKMAEAAGISPDKESLLEPTGYRTFAERIKRIHAQDSPGLA